MIIKKIRYFSLLFLIFILLNNCKTNKYLSKEQLEFCNVFNYCPKDINEIVGKYIQGDISSEEIIFKKDSSFRYRSFIDFGPVIEIINGKYKIINDTIKLTLLSDSVFISNELTVYKDAQRRNMLSNNNYQYVIKKHDDYIYILKLFESYFFCKNIVKSEKTDFYFRKPVY